MSDELTIQLEKLNGLNQLLLSYTALLESERSNDYLAMNILFDNYSEVTKMLSTVCDYYVEQNQKEIEEHFKDKE